MHDSSSLSSVGDRISGSKYLSPAAARLMRHHQITSSVVTNA